MTFYAICSGQEPPLSQQVHSVWDLPVSSCLRYSIESHGIIMLADFLKVVCLIMVVKDKHGADGFYVYLFVCLLIHCQEKP